MRSQTVCIAAALVAAALAWPAQGAPVKERKCGEIAQQGEMNMCFTREWKSADDQLNKKYQQLVARLKSQKLRPEAFTLLRESERAWIQYRDTQCNFETYQNVGGTVHSSAISVCMTAMTNDRIRLLEEQLECAQGDWTCVAPNPSQQ